MVDKKVLKFYLIGLIFSALIVIIPAISNFSSEHMQSLVYTIPIGANGYQQSLFFYILAFLIPYVTIFIGYALAYIVVRIYTRFTKFSKRIEFVGYANTDRSGHYLRRRYIIHLIFASLLATNIWIMIVTNPGLMQFWLTDASIERMYATDGSMLNFTMIPWYWVPLVIVVPIFAMCAVIQDSGLVSVRKLSGQSEFADTERIGDKIFGIVKGYAGISVIFSFISLIQSPLGLEMSLVLYPLNAMTYLLHLIIAMDLFRDVGKKWIIKAVKHNYTPQIIEMSYIKKDIADTNELLTKKES